MLSIIIVNWKSAEYLTKCISSILKYLADLEYEIIVADNNSGDNLDQLRNNKIVLLELEKNYGFAKANNLAFKKAKGDSVLFLNPDTVFIDSSLINILKYQKLHNDIGVIGCQILNPDRTVQNSVRTFPTLISHILILLKLHRFFSNSRSLNEYLMRDFDYGRTQEVDQVMGAFFLTSKNIFEKLGKFDENFFIWYEEVDFCKRVKQAGLKIIYYPATKIVHHYSKSFEKEQRLKKQLILTKSMRYYFKKNSNIISYLIITFFSGISLLITLLLKLIYNEKVVINKKT